MTTRVPLAIALVGVACGARSPTPRSLASACTIHPPRVDVRALIGLDTPHPRTRLAGPWREVWDTYLGDDRVLVEATAGDEVAFAIAHQVEAGAHERWHVDGAVAIGAPCASVNLEADCQLDGVDDPWVFGETAIAYGCTAAGTPVVRAWRGRADGAIVAIDPAQVTCGGARCGSFVPE